MTCCRNASRRAGGDRREDVGLGFPCNQDDLRMEKSASTLNFTVCFDEQACWFIGQLESSSVEETTSSQLNM